MVSLGQAEGDGVDSGTEDPLVSAAVDTLVEGVVVLVRGREAVVVLVRGREAVVVLVRGREAVVVLVRGREAVVVLVRAREGVEGTVVLEGTGDVVLEGTGVELVVGEGEEQFVSCSGVHSAMTTERGSQMVQGVGEDELLGQNC